MTQLFDAQGNEIARNPFISVYEEITRKRQLTIEFKAESDLKEFIKKNNIIAERAMVEDPFLKISIEDLSSEYQDEKNFKVKVSFDYHRIDERDTL